MNPNPYIISESTFVSTVCSIAYNIVNCSALLPDNLEFLKALSNIHKGYSGKYRDYEGQVIFLRYQIVFCTFKIIIFIFPGGSHIENCVLTHRSCFVSFQLTLAVG